MMHRKRLLALKVNSQSTASQTKPAQAAYAELVLAFTATGKAASPSFVPKVERFLGEHWERWHRVTCSGEKRTQTDWLQSADLHQFSLSFFLLRSFQPHFLTPLVNYFKKKKNLNSETQKQKEKTAVADRSGRGQQRRFSDASSTSERNQTKSTHIGPTYCAWNPVLG